MPLPRKCTKCGERFKPKGYHNRLCLYCRRYSKKQKKKQAKDKKYYKYNVKCISCGCFYDTDYINSKLCISCDKNIRSFGVFFKRLNGAKNGVTE